MRIRIYNKLDLSNALEDFSIDYSNLTIYELLENNIQSLNLNKLDSVEILADGVKINKDLYSKFNLKNTKYLTFIINPLGLDPASWVAIVMAVISAAMTAYSMMTMKKVKTNTDMKSTTSSIYDPNAQGNKVHLEDPIPEHFGYVKAFPDCISDYHYYYKNNLRYMDILLCQGVGTYSNELDKVYIGNTPIQSYDDSLYKIGVYKPGEDISEHQAHLCWYSSTEVTSSGIEIKPSAGETKSGLQNLAPLFDGKTFKPYQSKWTVTGVDSQGAHGSDQIYKIHLNYEVGDIFKISNCQALTDLVVKNETVNDSTDYFQFSKIEGITTHRVTIACLPTKDFVTYHPSTITVKRYIHYYETHGLQQVHRVVLNDEKECKYTVVDDVTLDIQDLNFDEVFENKNHYNYYCEISFFFKNQNSLIKLADTNRVTSASNTITKSQFSGDLSTVTVGDILTFSVSTKSLNYTSRLEKTQWFTSQRKVTNVTSTTITLDKEFTLEYAKDGSQQGATVTILKQASFNSVYRDGNGYYRVINVQGEDKNQVYTVEAIDYKNFDYVAFDNWEGFSFQGHYSCDFNLLTGVNAVNNGVVTTAGPYRANPRGQTSRYYEVDLHFPSGIYELDGTDYKEHTVKILIEFRIAGSNGAWTQDLREYTYATPNEIGITIEYDMFNFDGSNGEYAYEFRVTNQSEYSDDINVVCNFYWNGLKCLIADKTSYDDVTVIALSIKGSETMSEANENQISTYWTRLLPDLDGELKETKQLLPVVRYICSQSRFNDLINIDNWLSYSELCNSAGVEFNYRFDKFSTILESLRTVLAIGYAEPIVNGNELLPKRRYKTDIIAQMFTPQNIIGDVKISYSMLTEDTDNELDVTYIDGDLGNGTWKETEFYADLDVKTNEGIKSYYQRSKNVQNFELLPCTDEQSAYNLAIHKLREMLYCRTTISFKTELDALNCQYGDVILVALPFNALSKSGRVVFYDTETLILTTDNSIDNDYSVIYIRRPDGSCFGCSCVIIDNYHVQLTQVLDFDLMKFYEENPQLEKCFYAFGDVQKCWVKSIKVNNETQATISAINYDDRIFVDDIFSGFGVQSFGNSIYQ